MTNNYVSRKVDKIGYNDNEFIKTITKIYDILDQVSHKLEQVEVLMDSNKKSYISEESKLYFNKYSSFNVNFQTTKQYIKEFSQFMINYKNGMNAKLGDIAKDVTLKKIKIEGDIVEYK